MIESPSKYIDENRVELHALHFTVHMNSYTHIHFVIDQSTYANEQAYVRANYFS